MWELVHKEGWAPKNWCFWTVMLKKTLKSPLDCKKIQPVHPKGNQSWIFNRRTVAEAEAPILWPLMLRAHSLERTLILRKIEGRRRREQQRMRWLNGIINSLDMNLSKLQEIVKDRGGWHVAIHWISKREEGSGWGTQVYLWRIHFDIWLNQYNIVKLKNKIKRFGHYLASEHHHQSTSLEPGTWLWMQPAQLGFPSLILVSSWKCSEVKWKLLNCVQLFVTPWT